LVRLIDVTVEQWLDLKYGNHMTMDVNVKKEVISTWLIRSYKLQFEEYLEIMKQRDTYTRDVDMEYDPSNLVFANWIASKIHNHLDMDWYTQNALWIYWARGDDEVKLYDEEPSDPNDKNLIDECEVAEIFRIETNVFDFETPTMIGFMSRMKMCHGYTKNNGWIMEYGKNPHLLNIIASLLIIKVDIRNGQLVAGYYNGGNLPRAYIVGNSLRYQDFEWYEALEDGELKEEALKNKAIMEGLIDEDDESSKVGWRSQDDYVDTNRDQEERDDENEHDDKERCELFDDVTQERPVCNIRRFEMIKYSFGDGEEYVAIKENGYDDLISTSEDACAHTRKSFARWTKDGW
ncbi:hypothetical protein Tco_0816457, partial [Tanacetum coccineum]